jgi:hypothetical protein
MVNRLLTEIPSSQELDRTDPSHRLVAHNKRTGSPNKFTTKLSAYRCLFCVLFRPACTKLTPSGRRALSSPPFTSTLPFSPSVYPLAVENNENVLDDLEQDTGDTFNDLYPSMASSSIMPKDTATEGMDTTTDNETVNSDDGRPHRLRMNQHSNQISNGRNVQGSALLASGASPLNNTPPMRKQMITKQGVRCPAIMDKTWKEVQQLCNIECGPNLVQRIENGARGISEASE